MVLCPLTLYMRQTPCLEAFILSALAVHPDLNLWDSSHLGGLVKSGYLCFPFSLYRRLWPLLSGVMHRYELSPLLVLWVRGVRSWLLKVVHFQKGYLSLLCYTRSNACHYDRINILIVMCRVSKPDRRQNLCKAGAWANFWSLSNLSLILAMYGSYLLPILALALTIIDTNSIN